MFGNFKRTKDIKAVTTFVKELHPMFQFRQIQEDHKNPKRTDAICLEGMKRIDDLQNVFSIRVDLADPDCLARLKEAYSLDGVFAYQELLDLVAFLSSEWQRAIKTWPEIRLNISLATNDWSTERLSFGPVLKATYQLYVEVTSPNCLIERFRATITRNRSKYTYVADVTASWRATTPVTFDGLKQLLTEYIDSRKSRYDSAYGESLNLASKLQRVPTDKLADMLIMNGRVYSALYRRFGL